MKETSNKFISVMLVVAFALLALPLDAGAQYVYRFSDSLGTYKVQFKPHNDDYQLPGAKYIARPVLAETHEFRLGIGWSAETPYGTTSTSSLPDLEDINPAYQYDNTRWITLTGDYGFWLKEWFYLGASLTWTNGSQGRYSSYDHTRYGTRSYDAISVMPTVRFAWLRRGIVQLYSGIGLGITCSVLEGDDDRGSFSVSNTFDVTWVGIAVGRNIFGYMDLGTSSRGILTAGIGYRFQSKK